MRSDRTTSESPVRLRLAGATKPTRNRSARSSVLARTALRSRVVCFIYTRMLSALALAMPICARTRDAEPRTVRASCDCLRTSRGMNGHNSRSGSNSLTCFRIAHACVRAHALDQAAQSIMARGDLWLWVRMFISMRRRAPFRSHTKMGIVGYARNVRVHACVRASVRSSVRARARDRRLSASDKYNVLRGVVQHVWVSLSLGR